MSSSYIPTNLRSQVIERAKVAQQLACSNSINPFAFQNGDSLFYQGFNNLY